MIMFSTKNIKKRVGLGWLITLHFCDVIIQDINLHACHAQNLRRQGVLIIQSENLSMSVNLIWYGIEIYDM